MKRLTYNTEPESDTVVNTGLSKALLELNHTYTRAASLAYANGNSKLGNALLDLRSKVAQVGGKTLYAICNLQD